MMAFVHECQRVNCQRFENYENRLDTFENWHMVNLHQSAEDLAHAGFFRVNDHDDVVQCFSCQIKLHAWEPSDSAFLEHERWSPMCSYIEVLKRKSTALLVYILPMITQTERQSVLRQDPRKCEQCQIDDISIVMYPCGHSLTCVVCAIPLLRCPRCRVYILEKKSINLP